MTQDDIDVLRETIQQGMVANVPNPDGPDYRCIYCGAEPEGSQYNPIHHRSDCSGEQSLAILAQAERELGS